MLKPVDIILAFNLLRNTFKKKTMNLISKLLVNPKKATGPNKIPVKIVKLAASVIDSHLTNIINNDLSNNVFSDSAKLASVRSTYKKVTEMK